MGVAEDEESDDYEETYNCARVSFNVQDEVLVSVLVFCAAILNGTI